MRMLGRSETRDEVIVAIDGMTFHYLQGMSSEIRENKWPSWSDDERCDFAGRRALIQWASFAVGHEGGLKEGECMAEYVQRVVARMASLVETELREMAEAEAKWGPGGTEQAQIDAKWGPNGTERAKWTINA